MTLRTLLLRSGALLLVCVVVGCPLADEVLPGRPCNDDNECGADFACVRVPGRESRICAPRPEGVVEQPVGCDGKDNGESCADGDACTVSDTCQDGVCVGAPRDCGDDVCRNGICEAQGSCEALTPQKAIGQAQAPKTVVNTQTGEIGLAYTGDVDGRAEAFFVVLSADGRTQAAPRQLTNGSADNLSSFVFDVAFAPAPRRFGVIVADGALLNSTANLHALTEDGLPAGRSRVTSQAASGGVLLPTALAWSTPANQFIVVSVHFDSNLDEDTLITDDLDSSASGGDLVDRVLATDPQFIDTLDVDTRDDVAEFGAVFATQGAANNVGFVRAPVDGAPLVERRLNAGRGKGENVTIAVTNSGYVVAWDEADGIAATALNRNGDVVVTPRLISDVGEGARRPHLATLEDGAVVTYIAGPPSSVRVRRLTSALEASAPITVQTDLPAIFAPKVSANVGEAVVSYGKVEANATSGDVEIARVCIE